MKSKKNRIITIFILTFVFIFIFLPQGCFLILTKEFKENNQKDDLFDTLLLYDSNNIRDSDINFYKISEYYGLKCKKIDLSITPLNSEIFYDFNGQHYKATAINAYNIENTKLIDNSEITSIKNLITNNETNLLISEIGNSSLQANHNNLKFITNNEVIGILNIINPCKSWVISDYSPEITREFTGQILLSSKEIQTNFSLLIDDNAKNTTNLICSLDKNGNRYSIVAIFRSNKSNIFLNIGSKNTNLEKQQMLNLYDVNNLCEILPTMMFVRYALGEECWHNNHDYANITIDDPNLKEPFSEELTYSDLLKIVKTQNFHITIGFIPKNYKRTDQEVVKLFLKNPDRFSIAMHGNNHDGYEFYKYSVQEDDKLIARPLSEQEKDIKESLTRMEEFEHMTGLSYSKIMIFPWGISPENTLILLKKYNFNATINAQDVPLEAERGKNYDYSMYQANMNYANFAVIQRRHPVTNGISGAIFDLFIDKPIFYYSHPNELFSIDYPLAEEIYSLNGTVEWKSLDFIVKHLYLEKLNDDGSIDIKMYGNYLILSNESDEYRKYHINKEENLNIPIVNLKINGIVSDYFIDNGILQLDIQIPPKSNVEVVITYGYSNN